MRTLVCILKFPDGAAVTATAASDSAELEVPVTYSGDLSRLRARFDTCDLGFLEWLMKSEAAKAGAELEVKADGEYTRWAE